jgi:hypothetical protein
MAEDTLDRLVVAHVWFEKAGSATCFRAITMKGEMLPESAELANGISSFDLNGRNILVKNRS